MIKDLKFQLNFKTKSGRTIPDNRIIHLLNFRKVHLQHISALYHPGISSGSKYYLPPCPIRRDIEELRTGVQIVS